MFGDRNTRAHTIISMPNKVIEYTCIYYDVHKHHILYFIYNNIIGSSRLKYKLIVNVSIVNLKKSARISSEIVHLMVVCCCCCCYMFIFTPTQRQLFP